MRGRYLALAAAEAWLRRARWHSSRSSSAAPGDVDVAAHGVAGRSLISKPPPAALFCQNRPTRPAAEKPSRRRHHRGASAFKMAARGPRRPQRAEAGPKRPCTRRRPQASMIIHPAPAQKPRRAVTSGRGLKAELLSARDSSWLVSLFVKLAEWRLAVQIENTSGLLRPQDQVSARGAAADRQGSCQEDYSRHFRRLPDFVAWRGSSPRQNRRIGGIEALDHCVAFIAGAIKSNRMAKWCRQAGGVNRKCRFTRL